MKPYIDSKNWVLHLTHAEQVMLDYRNAQVQARPEPDAVGYYYEYRTDKRGISHLDWTDMSGIAFVGFTAEVGAEKPFIAFTKKQLKPTRECVKAIKEGYTGASLTIPDGADQLLSDMLVAAWEAGRRYGEKALTKLAVYRDYE